MDSVLGKPFEETGEYKYKNCKLIPGVFGDILVYLFNGLQFERQEAVKEVEKFHVDHGGISHLPNYTGAFKKVCNRELKDYISNPTFRVWFLEYSAEEGKIETGKREAVAPKVMFSVDEEMGEGSGSVYVYYYDVYRDRALLRGDTHWECKVGKTDQSAMGRIYAQAGTAYPEFPHVALVIKCRSAKNMEDALHSVLKVRSRWIENAPGKEWFITSPDEIKEIYKSILGDMPHKEKDNGQK